jgi:hypothetical protein
MKKKKGVIGGILSPWMFISNFLKEIKRVKPFVKRKI